jgi:thymidylate synthase (FAD)
MSLPSVKLVDFMGSPLSIVNSARVSFGGRSETMSEKDWRLIRYLIKNDHSSPFRHVSFQFEIDAPVFTLRQWMKHQVGCAWNEISGRYVEFSPTYWEPEIWRGGSPDLKQGSRGIIEDPELSEIYRRAMSSSWEAYHELLDRGVCREQARTVLPLSLMSRCVWTASLQAVVHFLKLRLDHHAQEEIRLLAQGVRLCVESLSDDFEKLLSIMLGEEAHEGLHEGGEP